VNRTGTEWRVVAERNLPQRRRILGCGTAVIVDSRAEAAYKAEHIAGSINIDNESKFDTLPKGKKIIVYCS
jgi:rhodanese-related sulfurtransferase